MVQTIKLQIVLSLGDGKCSGLELSEQDEPPCKETKPIGGDITVDENPAYQTMEITMQK